MAWGLKRCWALWPRSYRRAGIGVARWAKARARPPAGTCPEGHDEEIVFQDKSCGFTRAAELAFRGTGRARAWRCECRSGVKGAPDFEAVMRYSRLLQRRVPQFIMSSGAGLNPPAS